MNSRKLQLNWSAAGDMPSQSSSINWTRLEKQYKETIKTQSGILQYVIKEYQDKVADLEKERDSWKKTAEKEREKMTQERKSLLDEKAQWMEKEANTISQLEAMKLVLQQVERIQKTVDEENQSLKTEKTNLQEQLTTREQEMNTMAGHLEWSDRINAQLRTKKDQLKAEIAELQREEALANCKICFERPVKNVFPCGHAVCDACYDQIYVAAGWEWNRALCHICRRKIGCFVRKIFFT